jgi:hypothetical protein
MTVVDNYASTIDNDASTIDTNRRSGWGVMRALDWKSCTTAALAVTAIVTAGARARTQTAAAPTAILAGQAVDAVTGAPVANTLIGLSQRARSGPNTTPTAPNTSLVTVMADSRGRFVIRDVPKGSFLLLATAPGYIVSNYGQARAGGPTRTIDLTGTERHVDLKIPLWRHGVISGEVVDESGEPVVGVVVRVLRRMPNGAGGEPRYIPGTATTTDDRGRYRLTALSPGRFLVTVPQTQVTVPASVVDAYLQAGASRAGGESRSELLDLMSSSSALPSAAGGVRIDDLLLQSSAGGRLMAIPPPASGGLLVYPTTIASSGSRDDPDIDVNAGDEHANVNLTLHPRRAYRISGIVTADGAPAAKVSVRLIRADWEPPLHQNGYEAAATVTAEDGTFTLLGVTPGKYVLKVLRTPRLALPPALAANPAITAAYTPEGADPPAGAAAKSPIVGGQVPIVVGDADRTDLVVALRPGAAVKGRALFTGTAPTPQQMQKFGALLASDDGAVPGVGLQIFRLTASGEFAATAAAPGRYSITILGPPAAGWRFAGVELGGAPLTRALDLGGDDVTDLTVTFTDEVGEVAGRLTRPDGSPVTTAGIVVFPIDRRAWRQDPLNPRQPRLEQSQRGGAFSISSLLAGEYFVAALDDADMPDLPTPAFLAAVSRVATRVRVEPRGRHDLALTIRRLK